MIPKGPEYSEVQRPAVELLQYVLDYEYLHGESEAFQQERHGRGDIILARRLEDKLRQFNPNLHASDVAVAIEALEKPEANDLAQINLEMHYRLTRRPRPATQVKATDRTLRYFDFDNPRRNDFLVVEQFPATSASGVSEVDLVIFVNGIPIAVLLVSPMSGREAAAPGLERLVQLQQVDAIPRLFYTSQFLMSLQKDSALYGPVSVGAEAYMKWEDPYPLDLEQLRGRIRQVLNRDTDLPSAPDIALAGLLAPENLLDIIQNFTAFDKHGDKPIRRLPRCHQYQAVNEALKRIANENGGRPWRERGGVLWLPVGTGRSLSIVWLLAKLQSAPSIAQPVVLVLTDRDELPDRISRTMAHMGHVAPMMAPDSPPLSDFLPQLHGRPVICSVKKFQAECKTNEGTTDKVISDSDTLIVLVDEVFRDNDSEFARDLRAAFPEACLVAFATTPLSKGRGELASGLREHVYIYTTRQAQQNGHTIPAKYEVRLPEHHVWDDKRVPAFAIADKKQLNGEGEQQAAVMSAALVEDRIETIAQDIYDHYRLDIQPNEYKALVASCCDEASLRYYQMLEPLVPGRVGIIMTQPPPHWQDVVSPRIELEEPAEVLHRFASTSASEQAILITSGHLPVDFRVPALQVIYLDRPAIQRQLLQLISWTQCVFDAYKTYGLIVDYWGIIKYLPQALAEFDPDEIGEPLSPRYSETESENLRRRRREILGFFESYLPRESTEPWLVALEPEAMRTAFKRAWLDFAKALDLFLPREQTPRLLSDASWFDRLRQDAAAFYYDEGLASARCGGKVGKVLDQYRREGQVTVVRDSISVYSPKFVEELDTLASTAARAIRIEQAVRHEVPDEVESDPAFYDNIKRRVQQISNERKQGTIKESVALEELLKELERLRAGPQAAAKALQLSEEQYAFFGMVQKYLAPTPAEKLALQDAHRTLTLNILATIGREMQVIDWTKKEDVQREMRRKTKRLLRDANCPEEALEPLTAGLMKLARVRFGERS